jgi:hypothetical protein
MLLIAGCAGVSAKPAAYELDLELCLNRSQTCEQYIECRKKVSAEYGRPFAGSCAAKDAGAE